jgi:hypothetical protein
MSSGNGAVLELADNALGDIAHGVNCANHLLLDDHIVEQAFVAPSRLIDERRIGLLRMPNSDRPISVGTMFLP